MMTFWLNQIRRNQLRLNQLRLTSALGFCLIAAGGLPVLAQSVEVQPIQTQPIKTRPVPKPLQVIVTSAQDGPVEADSGLTLREAIALTNGDLSRERLSPQEAALVQEAEQPQILFRLPENETTIRLKTALPSLHAVGLSLDATSQLGYGRLEDGLRPIVAITPAQGVKLTTGLVVMADWVAIRGLSVYGFTQADRQLNNVDSLSADILVTPEILNRVKSGDLPERPVQGVVLEHNWLGVMPNRGIPPIQSDFGVWIYNGSGTLVRNNYIAHHGGSGIITSVNAERTLINGNWLERNGTMGMPDGVRVSGKIGGTEVIANRISESGGSAIYLFKSNGSISVEENQLVNNGVRIEQGAIILMGNGHRILDNEIESQSGPGVVIAAYPQSNGILLKDNRFSHLKGLSIDLLTRDHTETANYLRGDGPNPRRDTGNRRLDTGNRAINTPEFLSSVFYMQGNRVNIDGRADAGATVTLYKVTEPNQDYGPLNEKLATTTADEKGRFGIALEGLKPGDRLSAIAAHPDYGTSEPALNMEVK